MARKRRMGPFTFDEFCFITGSDRKADLIDGAIYLDPPEPPAVNELFFWLLELVDGFVESRDLGTVYCLRVAFRIDNKNSPEPDIGFVRKDRRHLIRREFVNGAPNLALEVVAAESVERDYEKKLALYERSRVGEYWIVDPDLKKVIVYRLHADGKFRRVRVRNGELRSTVLPGFWIRPAWLWRRPRPTRILTLRRILARSE